MHIKCITEAEKYSGKDYQPRPNQNKGAKKQEAWVEMVRTIQRTKLNISDNVNKILSTISQHDNIPRKKASFIRFLQNSFRYMKMNDIEAAWGLLEEEMKKQKPVQQQQPSKAVNGSTNGEVISNGESTNGNSAKVKDLTDGKMNGATNGLTNGNTNGLKKKGKRKHDEVVEEAEEAKEVVEP